MEHVLEADPRSVQSFVSILCRTYRLGAGLGIVVARAHPGFSHVLQLLHCVLEHAVSYRSLP